MGGIARRAALVALGSAVLGGCDQPAEDLTYRADPIVAKRSSDSLWATVNLAQVATFYTNGPDLANVAVDQAPAAAVAEVRAKLEGVFKLLGCQATIDTDGTSYLDVEFTNCTGFLDLQGAVEADLKVITGTCASGTGTCPVATEWTLDGSSVQVGTPTHIFTPKYDGPLVVHKDLASDTITWTTDTDFLLHTRFGTFTAASQASWVEETGNCVTMDLQAELELENPAQGLDFDIGTIVVDARGMKRCRAKCPEGGTVQLAYGQGHVLSWTYHADHTVTVTGPRGRSLTAELPCAN